MIVVMRMPRKKTRGRLRVESRTSPAVCASPSNPAYAKKSGGSEIGKRADVRDRLQPRADERESVAVKRAREVRVLASRLFAERRREKNRIRDRRRGDRGCEEDVTEDYARSGQLPREARDLENAGADERADERGV